MKATRSRRTRLQREIRDDDGGCVYCGGPNETIDHVVPRSAGGSDCGMNKVAACKPCNLTKANRVIVGLPLTLAGDRPMNGRGGFLSWLMWRRVKHKGVVPLECPRTGATSTMQLCAVGRRGV